MEYITIKEKKQEWQRVLFTIANLFTLFSLLAKVIDEDIYTKPIAIGLIIIVFCIFSYYIFSKID